MRIFIFIFLAVELSLGTWATELFGFWTTLLIYFIPTVFGLPLVIFENQTNWAFFQQQMASGKAPDQPLFRLMAGFFGSLFLLVPSLLFRMMAVILLFPPTRFLIVFLGKNWIAKKMKDGAFQAFSSGRGFSFKSGTSSEPRFERDARVIDIEAVKISSTEVSESKGPARPKS